MSKIKRLEKIEISEKEISEYDNHRKIIIIPKDSIKGISIQYGFSEERPITSIFIGLVTLVPGVIFGILPLSQLLSRLLKGEQVHGNFGLYSFAAPLIFVGAWLIIKTFRTSYFLKIVTDKGIRKLSFSKNIEKFKIDLFAIDCNRMFEYNIKNNLDEKS